ncbi:MAG: hypothetical protein KME64_14845 [Scytonematopsis contorta HA4267-MV1]|jgi:hypothetical protein|nr:hypothetical protein [Scytonematopsis contorta HA4267-MV1]
MPENSPEETLENSPEEIKENIEPPFVKLTAPQLPETSDIPETSETDETIETSETLETPETPEIENIWLVVAKNRRVNYLKATVTVEV